MPLLNFPSYAHEIGVKTINHIRGLSNSWTTGGTDPLGQDSSVGDEEEEGEEEKEDEEERGSLDRSSGDWLRLATARQGGERRA